MGDGSRRKPAGTVVVGASVAGVRVARSLRRDGYARPIVLVGEEPELPYDKPPLSKQYLHRSMDPGDLLLLSREDAERECIDLLLGVPASALEPEERRVVLADGSNIDYEYCVLATGASARPSPWEARSGVYLLRTRRDSDALSEALSPGRLVAVVGGGFIGAEVASAAAAKGCDVVVIDPLQSPLARVVGEELGRRLVGLHARHGVRTRFGVGVVQLSGVEGHLSIRLTDGGELGADVAVVGIGAVCNDAWLAGSGLRLDDGVVCDEFCRVEGLGSVYASGDLARWFHRRHQELVRVEHWTNAVEQAACVARSIASGTPVAYEPVEYVWSDQYDVRIQVVGRPGQGARIETVGDTSSAPERMAVLYATEPGELTGAVTLNWPRALVECRRLVASGANLEAAIHRLSSLRLPPLGAAAH
jgi:phthalate 3,4-dioxygenase ferredoxin reductase subunit